MKIKILVLSLFTLVQSSSNAQISLRPYVGLNYSGFYFPKPDFYNEYSSEMKTQWQDEKDKFNYRPLINAGFHVDIPVSDYFSMETGLRFIQKGGVFKDLEDDGFGYMLKFENRMRYDVIEVPILLNYNMEIGDAILTISGGPTVGGIVNLRQKIAITESFDGETYSETFDTKEDAEMKNDLLSEINRFDLGANLGVRLDYYNFSFGLNYGSSFLSIAEDTVDEEFVPYFQNYQFTVGYKFELD